MARPLAEYFGYVDPSDIVDYGAGYPSVDFLEYRCPTYPASWIVTNPPFNRAVDFAERA